MVYTMNSPRKILSRDPDFSKLMEEMNRVANTFHEGDEATVTLFQFFETFPLPVWIKMLNGETIHSNRAYRADFVTADTPDAMLNQREEHIINDVRAADQGEAILVTETEHNPRTGKDETYLTAKWPLEVEIVDDQGAHWTEAMGGCYLMLIGGGERHGFPF